jgi:hypothetical protein
MAKESQSGTVARRVDTFHQRMIERAGLDNNRAEEVMSAQGERILSATTVDEIWDADAAGTVQCRDVPGTIWQITGFEPVVSRRTDLDNARGYYVNMTATYLGGPRDVAAANALVIGQEYALQTGADLIVYKLAMFEAAKAFPIKAMIHEITTAKGKLLKLVRPPDMAQTGDTE